MKKESNPAPPCGIEKPKPPPGPPDAGRVVKNTDLIPLLDAVIDKVFDNEKRFMLEVYRPGEQWRGELIDFYMSSDRCRLTVLLECGQHITDTVKTADVLEWLQGV